MAVSVFVKWKPMLTVGTATSETLTSEQTIMTTFATNVTTGRSHVIICLFSTLQRNCDVIYIIGLYYMTLYTKCARFCDISFWWVYVILWRKLFLYGFFAEVVSTTATASTTTPQFSTPLQTSTSSYADTGTTEPTSETTLSTIASKFWQSPVLSLGSVDEIFHIRHARLIAVSAYVELKSYVDCRHYFIRNSNRRTNNYADVHHRCYNR